MSLSGGFENWAVLFLTRMVKKMGTLLCFPIRWAVCPLVQNVPIFHGPPIFTVPNSCCSARGRKLRRPRIRRVARSLHEQHELPGYALFPSLIEMGGSRVGRIRAALGALSKRPRVVRLRTTLAWRRSVSAVFASQNICLKTALNNGEQHIRLRNAGGKLLTLERYSVPGTRGRSLHGHEGLGSRRGSGAGLVSSSEPTNFRLSVHYHLRSVDVVEVERPAVFCWRLVNSGDENRSAHPSRSQ